MRTAAKIVAVFLVISGLFNLSLLFAEISEHYNELVSHGRGDELDLGSILLYNQFSLVYDGLLILSGILLLFKRKTGWILAVIFSIMEILMENYTLFGWYKKLHGSAIIIGFIQLLVVLSYIGCIIVLVSKPVRSQFKIIEASLMPLSILLCLFLASLIASRLM